MKFKLPTIKELTTLIVELKKTIGDEYRASEEDTLPSMCVTVGANRYGDWSFQTGDNSLEGEAYDYPYWAVVSIYRDSNSREIAKEIQDQLDDLMTQ